MTGAAGAMFALFSAVQTSGDLAKQLQWITGAQVAMAVTMIVIGLFLVVLAIGGIALLRALRHGSAAIERVTRELAPKTDPLLENMSRVAENAAVISDALRAEMTELQRTVGDLNRQVRDLAESAESRTREFGAVVTVVQQEVQGMLLDATAAARGLHTAAEALHRKPATLHPPSEVMEGIEPPPGKEGPNGAE